MGARRHVLDNGLKVVIEPSRRAPVVAVQVWINAGAADERRDQAGLAHVHEHMMFKGTERRGPGEIAREIEASGGEINAWTSFDQTVYHTVSAASELDTCLDVLSDALTRPAFDPDELARELEVIVEEIKRAQDSPARRLSRAMFESAFQSHPYRYPVLGTEESVRSFNRDRVQEFWRGYYRPDNATVVVVGDEDEAAILDGVGHWFGGWSAESSLRRRPRAMEPEQDSLRLAAVSHSVKEARASIAWKIPAVSHADVPALDMLGVVLGHGESSRLSVEVHRRLRLVNAVSAYAYTPSDPGLFVVGATMKSENVGDAVSALNTEVRRLVEGRVSDDELEKARTVMLSDSAYQRETVQGLARKLGYFESVCGDFAFDERYVEAIRSLTADELSRAAAEYLTTAPTAVLVDDSPSEDTLARALDSETPKKRRARRAQELTRLELSSGARLIMVPEAGPVVAYRAVALGGLRWEDRSTNGLSQLLTACWARRTPTLDAEAFATRVASLGGALTAFSGRNTLGLRGEFIVERWRAGLELGLDAILRSELDEEELERERALTLERIRNRADNPAGLAFDTFLDALFPSHPYGRRLVGSVETVSRFTLEDVSEWREHYLDPRRLVFTIVGNVDVDEVARVLEDVLGGEPVESLATRVPVDSAPLAPVERRVQSDKNQCHVVIGAMGTTIDDDARNALNVLTTVLAGQGGRLFRDLRDDQSLAYSVSSANIEGLDPGHVLTYGATSPDKVGRMIDGLHRHLDAIIETPIESSELDRAKRYLVGTHSIDLQRAGARAMVMALGELFGLGFDHFKGYDARVAAVTADDVQRVAARFLDRKNRVEVVLGPE
ncbi:MAG: pitrilysin family protein [Myxococcota bacterium]